MHSVQTFQSGGINDNKGAQIGKFAMRGQVIARAHVKKQKKTIGTWLFLPTQNRNFPVWKGASEQSEKILCEEFPFRRGKAFVKGVNFESGAENLKSMAMPLIYSL